MNTFWTFQALALSAVVAGAVLSVPAIELPAGHTAADLQQEQEAAEWLKMQDIQCRQDGQDDVVSIQLNIEYDCGSAQ